jgi:hypothetical protein
MVSSKCRFLLLTVALVAAVPSFGCNMSALPYFLSGCPEHKNPAGEMELTPPEKSKEIKAIILTYSGIEATPEFITVDRELSGLLSRKLQQACKANDQKLTLVSANKVQDYKNSHPDWHMRTLDEIGKRFDVDYVIYLGIESMSLYEKGSANQLYRGHADIHVTLVNMHKLDEDPLEHHFSCEYPGTSGPIPADDKNPHEFHLAFLNHVAQNLARLFADYPVRDTFCEG